MLFRRRRTGNRRPHSDGQPEPQSRIDLPACFRNAQPYAKGRFRHTSAPSCLPRPYVSVNDPQLQARHFPPPIRTTDKNPAENRYLWSHSGIGPKTKPTGSDASETAVGTIPTVPMHRRRNPFGNAEHLPGTTVRSRRAPSRGGDTLYHRIFAPGPIRCRTAHTIYGREDSETEDPRGGRPLGRR